MSTPTPSTATNEPTGTPEGPPATFPTTEPYQVSHRWPWRTNEYVTMAVFFTLCLAAGLASRTVTGIILGTVAALASQVWLYRTKMSRINISAVHSTITGTRIKVASKGVLGLSAVDTAKVTTVAYRRYLSDETFMLADGTQTARIPLRATSDPVVRAAVEHAWTNAAAHSADAKDLYSAMQAGHLPG